LDNLNEFDDLLVPTVLHNTQLSVTSEEAMPIVDGYGTASFYGETLQVEDKRTRFIKTIVSTIRKSPEYSRYRTFLIENVDMGHCSILSSLSDEDIKCAGLEIHHTPLGLYDIAEMVLGQMEYDQDRITTFAVANRVMAYHWKGYVGLVPLTQTLHEAVHAGQITVDPRSVFGNWQALMNENRAGITEHLALKLRALVTAWADDETKQRNANALEVSLQRWTSDALTKENVLAGPADLLLPSDDGL
jgi:hypothetical protein